MNKYLAKVPFIDDMGSISDIVVSDMHMESKEELLLWHINSMRDHDCLPHLTELPDGVVFEKVKKQSTK